MGLRLATLAGLAMLGGCAMFARHESYVPERPSLPHSVALAAITGRDRSIYAAANRFADRFLRSIVTGDGVRNQAVSPLAANLALSILINGSQSESFEACAKAMGLSDPSLDRLNEANTHLLDHLASLPGAPLRMGGSVWNVLPVRFNKDFSADMARIYSADCIKLGSARRNALSQVNDWVSAHTQGKFRRAFVRLDPSAVAVLLNTCCLQIALPPCGQGSFQAPTGPVPVTWLKSRGDVLVYLDGQAVWARVVQVGELSLWVAQPQPGSSPAGLVKGTRGLIEAQRRARPEPGNVVLPALDLVHRQGLADSVTDLGGGRLLKPGNDFTPLAHELAPLEESAVGGLEQFCTFSLVSDGSPAPRTTAERTFTFDHPFAFWAVDDATGSVLLAGVVSNPAGR